jgi:hypothetical protein
VASKNCCQSKAQESTREEIEKAKKQKSKKSKNDETGTRTRKVRQGKKFDMPLHCWAAKIFKLTRAS